jgi:hypothetical protein
LGLDERRRGFDPTSPILLNLFPQPLTAFSFVVGCFAGGECLQMPDESRSLDHRTTAVTLRGERGQNLLSPPPAYLKEILNDFAIHPRDRQLLEYLNGFRE